MHDSRLPSHPCPRALCAGTCPSVDDADLLKTIFNFTCTAAGAGGQACLGSPQPALLPWGRPSPAPGQVPAGAQPGPAPGCASPASNAVPLQGCSRGWEATDCSAGERKGSEKNSAGAKATAEGHRHPGAVALAAKMEQAFVACLPLPRLVALGLRPEHPGEAGRSRATSWTKRTGLQQGCSQRPCSSRGGNPAPPG